MEGVTETTAEVLRRVYPRVLARTLGFTRSLPEAEDAVQEAVVRALAHWPERGTPEAPEAWLHTVATNFHRDRLRKGKWEAPEHDALEMLAEMSPWVRIAVGEPAIVPRWKDELLRLIFSCCHPVLEAGEGAALCLSTVVGLSNKEIAAAFVVEPRSMEQRLSRARRRLRERGDPDGRSPSDSKDRLDAALRVIHLLFNEGYWSSEHEAPIRANLCRLAMGLAFSLAEEFPEEPEVLGLAALLKLHDSRRPARLDSEGRPVALPDQDRSRWDRAAVAEGERLLGMAASLAKVGPLQLEAAISLVHSRAARADETDWQEIADLYRALEDYRATPAVRVNRAFAVGKAVGPAQGLELLEGVDAYPYVHLVRGALLEEMGELEAARDSFERAALEARNSAERAQIRGRLRRLGVDI